jgi:hypothetical protein
MSRKWTLKIAGRNYLDARLAAYVAAAGGSAALASSANADIVANTVVQPFGINGDVNIDFNHDGQTDFQIDHDRYNLNGQNLDYLQLDKNDVNSASNPFPINTLQTFPPNGTPANDWAQPAYLTDVEAIGAYPAALTMGSEIGPTHRFDFQEGAGFGPSSNQTIRANRLIDEDHTLMDTAPPPGGQGLDPSRVYQPTDGPNFLGLNGDIRYLGVRMDLNNADPAINAEGSHWTYGWIAVRIDNEADATGAVVGYGYQSTPDTAIAAGDFGPVVANADYNDDGKVDGADFLVWQRNQSPTAKVIPLGSADGTGDGLVTAADLAFWKTKYGTAVPVASAAGHAVPEPASAVMSLGGALLVGSVAWRTFLRKARSQA